MKRKFNNYRFVRRQSPYGGYVQQDCKFSTLSSKGIFYDQSPAPIRQDDHPRAAVQGVESARTIWPSRSVSEGLATPCLPDEQSFCPALLRRIAQPLMFTNPELSEFFTAESKQVRNFEELSQWISRYIAQTRKQVVLMIDEVDKSSNNQIFLHFWGCCGKKYLQRNEGQDYTFQSVILAGVHDVKTLKLKIRPDAEQKYNSPWNIAVDFTVDLSFNADEIVMLRDYQQETGMAMDAPAIAEETLLLYLRLHLSGQQTL